MFSLVVLVLFTGFSGFSSVGASNEPHEDFVLRYDGKKHIYDVAKNEPKSSIHTIEHRYQRFGKKGTPAERAELLGRVMELGFGYEEAFKYVFKNFDVFVAGVIKGVSRPSKDSKISFYPNRSDMFDISREQVGFVVNKEQLYKKMYIEYCKTGKIDIEIIPQVLEPRYTYDELSAVDNLKAKFGTYYGSSGADRRHNINLALRQLNGMRIEPNEEYSFNKITGRRTEANGYRKANIIINDEYVEGYGGGVCQVSTTLYNALLLSGADITEVRRHSLPSSYVALGFDAMVSHGTSDLKFINRSSLPMFIKAYSTQNNIYIEVYGASSEPDFKIKRITEIIRKISPAPSKTIIDTAGEHSGLVNYTDETAVLHYAKDGYEVNAYLEYYIGSTMVGRKLIRHETYKPQQGVYVRGAKKRPLPPLESEPLTQIIPLLERGVAGV
ncbi:MAG: VanW family protein [Firmicutes bacterium]|nr:VanW family protein [Bacillota bacterium]